MKNQTYKEATESHAKATNQEVMAQNLGISRAPLWFSASGKMGKLAVCSLKSMGFEGVSWSFYPPRKSPPSQSPRAAASAAQSHSCRLANGDGGYWHSQVPISHLLSATLCMEGSSPWPFLKVILLLCMLSKPSAPTPLIPG